MSDRTFERAVRDWLDDGSDRTPRPAFDAVLLAIKTTPQERALRIPRRFNLMPTYLRLTAAAIAVLALVGGGAIWYAGQSTDPSPPTSTGSTVPSLAPSPTALPTAARTPTTPDGVRGWPGNRGSSEPGLYSWDGAWCATSPCLMGVLHNHGASGGGEVRISIERVTEWSISASDARATPVTVAGHEGLYLRLDPQLEEWNVDFDGTLLRIAISTESGASQANIDEAHSIIESLAYEQRDTALGFRLVFTLPSSQWDSPF